MIVTWADGSPDAVSFVGEVRKVGCELKNDIFQRLYTSSYSPTFYHLLAFANFVNNVPTAEWYARSN